MSFGLTQFAQAWPGHPATFERICQFTLMAAVGLFGWVTLRRAFHGSVLTDPGVWPAENILRSLLLLLLLLLTLAIGFLLQGIRRAHRDCRIGSFVAPGFSLSRIGWLCSRQLTIGLTKPDPH